MSTTMTTEPTHELTRSIGAIPSGHKGVAEKDAAFDTASPVGPERERDITALRDRYPYRFMPASAGLGEPQARKDAIRFAREAGGILVSENEVKRLN